MKTVLFTLASLALLAPVGLAGQDGGWWAPLSLELPQSQQDAQRSAVCRLVPSAPACQGDAAERDDSRSDRDDDDGWETRRGDRNGKAKAGRARRGNGPPFCRNGQGHPVHGKQWCRDKGWDRGAWVDVSWEDVILGRRDRERRDRRATLDRGGLLDVLGSVVLGRLEGSARAVGGGPLTGRLVDHQGQLLQIRAGDVPLAELLDIDRDGRVDRVLLRTAR